jgi:type IV secretion system protein VirB9
MRVHLEPWQMAHNYERTVVRIETFESAPPTPPRPRTSSTPTQHRKLVEPKPPTPKETTPADVVDQARREATQQSTPDGFINAVQVYQYEQGVVYEVITSPGFVTALRLRPGEELLDLAAGDTTRWLVQTIESGTQNESRPIDSTRFDDTGSKQITRTSVLLKPRRPLLQTNLVIATNERTYLIDAKSVEAATYHSVVEWTYPMSELLVRRRAAAAQPQSTPSTTLRNYAYVVKVPPGSTPPFTPVSVYDDGARLYLKFSGKVDTTRRPPLFAVGKDGSVRMINYVIENDSYIIPELLDRLELKLGNDRVVIERVHERPRTLFSRIFGE